MSSESYHEPYEALPEDVREMHRALVSLVEEIEAVDWYQQRASSCSDPELAAVLLHHKNEEIEHAMMNLEYIRRRDPDFHRIARTFLFTEGSITALEEEAGGAGTPSPEAGSGTLGIGSLRDEARGAGEGGEEPEEA